MQVFDRTLHKGSVILGADPEFLLTQRGEPVAAYAVGIPDRNSKKDYGVRGEAGRFFRDGFGLELNPTPFNCIQMLLFYTGEGLKEVAKLSQAEPRAVAAISPSLSVSLGENPPSDVLSVGCNPSFNVYEGWGQPLTAPWSPLTHELRMFSGHLHFSMPTAVGMLHNEDFVTDRIRALDLVLGVVHTYIFQDERDVFERRVFYGRAGEYRLQNYGNGKKGIEYRTPDATLFRSIPIAALLIALARSAFLDPRSVLEQAQRELGLQGKDLDVRLRLAIDTGEGLESLLLSSYHHGLGVPNFGTGTITSDTVRKLREQRERLFPPTMQPLDVSGRKRLGEGWSGGMDGYSSVQAWFQAGSPHYHSWPQYPLYHPEWREVLNGATV